MIDQGNAKLMKLKRLVLIITLVFMASVALGIQAHPANGIVLDHEGNIYFSDLETIWKIDPTGKLSVFRQGVSGRHVHELAIDTQDNIYGGDYTYEAPKFISAIWKMTPDGKFEYLLPPTGDPPRAMSIWRDREGNNYWIDQNNHTKKQTLLLRRAPDGKVTTLAGSTYGHADGKGSAARFSSIGGMAFGSDGSLYLADGASVRKVALDGTVTTLANDLNARTSDDKPIALAGLYGNLAGLAVDSGNNVYVADAGNRRLFKINSAGQAKVVLRTDPPFFPNGVVAAPDGSVYVLEVGFTLPSTTSGPRVRRISPDGKNTILARIGAESEKLNPPPPLSRNASEPHTTFQALTVPRRATYAALLLAAAIVGTCVMIWKRRRRPAQ